MKGHKKTRQALGETGFYKSCLLSVFNNGRVNDHSGRVCQTGYCGHRTGSC